MLTPLPVVIIGGYLGAGKTTLINHLLRHAGRRRVAVLVNDFGEINIDADLIEGTTAGVISLSGGCLCCSFGDDLAGTLHALSQGGARPDLVLIELSGVAMPAPVARTIGLALGVELAGTLVLVNAPVVQGQAGDRYVGETVLQQLRDANWILLNRLDLVAPDAAPALSNWLAETAPQARVMPSGAREIDPCLVLDWRRGAADARHTTTAMQNRPIGWSRRHRQRVFSSRSFALPANADLAALGRTLAAPGSGILRAKALAVDQSGRTCCLQVGGGAWQVDFAPEKGKPCLVVIGLKESIASDPEFFSRLGL